MSYEKLDPVEVWYEALDTAVTVMRKGSPTMKLNAIGKIKDLLARPATSSEGHEDFADIVDGNKRAINDAFAREDSDMNEETSDG